MKKILVFIVSTFCSNAFAQQMPHFSQYNLNDYVMNPAIGGSRDFFEGKSNNRYQWEGITDAPRTYILSVQGPTKNHKIGLGGKLFTDITGPTRRTGADFSFAYHIKLNENIKLGLGASAGLLQFLVDGSKITLREEDDVALSNGMQSALVPDATFGFYLYSQKFYFGASAPQILQSKLRFFDKATNTESKLEDHYYAMAGYKLNISDDFQVEPSILAKMAMPAPLQLDLGARIIYKDRIWLGGAYRTHDAVTATIGFNYNNLLFGYSHDFTMSNLKNYSSGTHEIMVGVKFIQSKSTELPVPISNP